MAGIDHATGGLESAVLKVQTIWTAERSVKVRRGTGAPCPPKTIRAALGGTGGSMRPPFRGGVREPLRRAAAWRGISTAPDPTRWR